MSIPSFQKEQVILKPREWRFIKIKVTFMDDTLGMVTVKMFQKGTLDVTNISLKNCTIQS